MEGMNNNLSKSDISNLDALEQQLFAVKQESGLDGLTKASKAGVLLLQNPKLEKYAQSKGNPLQFKAKVKKQISQLQQQIQQAQLDKSNEDNQRGNDQDMTAPVAMASAPVAASQVIQQPQDTRIQDADEAYEEAMRVKDLANVSKNAAFDPKSKNQATRNEYQAANDVLDDQRRDRPDADKAYEEAMQMQELAKGPDGKASRDDYQAANDKQNYKAMEQKLKDNAAADAASKPGNSREKAAEDIKKQTAPATKDKPAGNAKPEKNKFDTSGGNAPKAKGRIGQAIQGAKNIGGAADQLAKKAGGKLAAAAAAAAGLGGLSGIADKVGQWATDKLLPFFKKYKMWLMTPTFLLIMLLGSTSMGVAGALMQRDGRNGGTNQDTLDYANTEDRSYLDELNTLMGSFDFNNTGRIEELVNTITEQIESGKLTFSDNATALQKLSQAKTLIAQYKTDHNAHTRKEIIVLIGDVVKSYSGNPALVNPSGFANPIGNQTIISTGDSYHGRSVLRREDTDGHDVFYGWGSPGTGDAVDLVLATSSGSNKPVYAMFTGTVTIDGTLGSNDSCAVLTSTGRPEKIQAWYCHTHDIVKGNVTAGQQIAKIGRHKHVHFEVNINKKSIHHEPGEPKGLGLWNRIKTTFNFQ